MFFSFPGIQPEYDTYYTRYHIKGTRPEVINPDRSNKRCSTYAVNKSVSPNI